MSSTSHFSINGFKPNLATTNTGNKHQNEAIRNPTILGLIVILILLVSFGIMGNILNLIVFSRKKMRRLSTFHFLFYLSAADLLVLLVCSLDAILKFGFQIEIRLYSTVICRLHTFLTYFLTQMSSIILMV